MENNIKNIRKSSNTKIIIVSDDKTILEKDIKDLYSDFEELKIISSSDSINYKNISFNDSTSFVTRVRILPDEFLSKNLVDMFCMWVKSWFRMSYIIFCPM